MRRGSAQGPRAAASERKRQDRRLRGKPFVVALGALFAFEYFLYIIVRFGTCASGPPYVIARPCPAKVGQLIAILPISILVAVGGGIATAALLGGRWGIVLWAALFVPLGAGFGVVASANANANLGVAVVFYGLAAMFVIMGVAPFFMSQKTLEG
jgi:hypothetical protein